MSQSRPTALRRAFTLVELLVVIGIIALLISILLPALGTAREQGRTVQCLANLRSIGQAQLMYISEYEGHTVPGYADRTVKAAGGANFADAENFATILVNRKFLTAPTVSSITDGIYRGPSVFRCPSGIEDLDPTQFANASGAAPYPTDRRDGKASQPWRVKSRSTGIVIDTWYGWNATIDEGKKSNTPARRVPAEQSATDMTIPKITQMSDASRMVFLFDGAFLNLYYEGDRIHARHGKAKYSNIVFFDGHAATYTTEDLPGGLGPCATGTDYFVQPRLGKNTELLWRMDQR